MAVCEAAAAADGGPEEEGVWALGFSGSESSDPKLETAGLRAMLLAGRSYSSSRKYLAMIGCLRSFSMI